MAVGSSQKGFTLIELLAVMAVGGMLLSGLVTAIFQSFEVTRRDTTKIIALENVKNATYRISKDVRMAQTTNLVDGAPPVDTLVLDWTSWYDATGQLETVSHHCEYTLYGGVLLRSYDYGIAATVAQYISSTEFSRQGQIILVTIASSPEGGDKVAEKQDSYMYLQVKADPVQ